METLGWKDTDTHEIIIHNGIITKLIHVVDYTVKPDKEEIIRLYYKIYMHDFYEPSKLIPGYYHIDVNLQNLTMFQIDNIPYCDLSKPDNGKCRGIHPIYQSFKSAVRTIYDTVPGKIHGDTAIGSVRLYVQEPGMPEQGYNVTHMAFDERYDSNDRHVKIQYKLGIEQVYRTYSYNSCLFRLDPTHIWSNIDNDTERRILRHNIEVERRMAAI